MSDWEEAIEFELDNSFLMTRTSIIILQHSSNILRSKLFGGKCNALADKCDVERNRLMARMYRKVKV